MKRPRRAVSAGGVVINSRGEVAVVEQIGSESWHSWSLPKGHVEGGEDKVETAKREIYEETGISDLTYVKSLGSYKRYKNGKYGKDDKSELKTIYQYLFTTNQLVLKPTDPHNPQAKWVKKEEVADLLTHRKDKAFFKSVFSCL